MGRLGHGEPKTFRRVQSRRGPDDSLLLGRGGRYCYVPGGVEPNSESVDLAQRVAIEFAELVAQPKPFGLAVNLSQRESISKPKLVALAIAVDFA